MQWEKVARPRPSRLVNLEGRGKAQAGTVSYYSPTTSPLAENIPALTERAVI